MPDRWGEPDPDLERAHAELERLIATARTSDDPAERERALLQVDALSARARQFERDASRQRNVLVELADELALIVATEAVASLVVDRTAEVLGADRVAIALANRVPEQLVLLASRGLDADRLARYAVFPESDSLPLARAHVTRAPVPIDVEGFTGLAVPLLVGGRSLGGFGVSYRPPHAPREVEYRLLVAIARQTAFALERAELLARAQRETERVRFLVRAGDLLSATLDVRATLAALARLAVPALADWAAVDLFTESGQVDRVAVAHVDPAKVKLAEDLVRDYPPDLSAESDALGRIFRTGEPQYVADLPDEVVEAAARDARHLEIIRRLELHSYVCVPIRWRGRVRGAFTLIGAESGRRYGQDDMRFAMEIAQRAAIALTVAETMEDLRRAEQTAKEAWDRLQLHLESSPAAVIELDSELRVTRWSDEAERVFGWAASDVLQGELGTWRWLDPSEQHKLEHLIDDMRGGMRVRAVLPTRSHRRDRSVTWCEWYVSGVHDDGRLASVLCLVLDVTDRVRAQQALEESDRRKDEFLAMLGHELRNPLSAIANATRVLELLGSPEPRQKSAYAVIERQVGHMKHLLDDLLDVARISRGKLTIQKKPVDLAAVVRETIADHRPSVSDASITLETRVPGTPVMVEGDETRLSQVLSNLLHNSTKFTADGGRIVVKLEVSGDRAVLCVSDTGVGIDPAEMPMLFEPFTQARSPRDPAHSGLGLGLALVKGVVELHGGSIVAESAGPGRGATFTIRLPLAAKSAEGDDRTPTSGPGGLKVLIVEDDPDSGEMLGMLLSAMGHDATWVSAGNAAVPKAREIQPDLVLCDLGLPGEMDGYDVARAMRAAADLRQPYLVALSGYGQPEHVNKARESGFDRHATKPLTPDKLDELLVAAKPRR